MEVKIRIRQIRQICWIRVHIRWIRLLKIATQSSLINIKEILDRSITKFYNGDDENVVLAELRLTKTR